MLSSFTHLSLLKYLNQKVVEAVIFMAFSLPYLKFNAPAQVKLVVEYSHIHISSLLCTRACSKPLGWFNKEGKLIWDWTTAKKFIYISRGTCWEARGMSSIIVDVKYIKQICCVAVCYSNYWVSVMPTVQHPSIHRDCDLDGYGFVSGISSCRNKWHFEKSPINASCPKVNACVSESDNC